MTLSKNQKEVNSGYHNNPNVTKSIYITPLFENYSKMEYKYMKTKMSIAVFVLISLVIVSYIPLSNAGAFHYSDEYHFQDVYVVIIGRCRTIGSTGEWMGGLFIGNQSHPSIEAFNTPLERLNINIYEQLKTNPCFSLRQAKNISVHLIDTKGIFFWSCWSQSSARFIPPIVFVYCYTEKISIYLV